MALPAFWVAAGLFFSLAAALEFSGLDLWLQDWFFNPSTHSWLVDSKDQFAKAAFYSGPKILLISLSVLLLGLLAGPDAWRRRLEERGWHGSRSRLAWAFFCAACIPLAVAALKASSNVPCPSELSRYGGSATYRRPFDQEVCGEPRGRCWPAGHASGGFSLVALALLARRRAQILQWFGISSVAGWTMGMYQTLKGAHFISHTVVTMALALCTVAIFAHLLAWSSSRERSR